MKWLVSKSFSSQLCYYCIIIYYITAHEVVYCVLFTLKFICSRHHGNNISNCQQKYIIYSLISVVLLKP